MHSNAKPLTETAASGLSRTDMHGRVEASLTRATAPMFTVPR